MRLGVWICAIIMLVMIGVAGAAASVTMPTIPQQATVMVPAIIASLSSVLMGVFMVQSK